MSSSYEKIEQDPNYQELVRRRSSLGWSLTMIMLIIYFGFILLVAYAPKFLGTPLGTGVMTIGVSSHRHLRQQGQFQIRPADP